MTLLLVGALTACSGPLRGVELRDTRGLESCVGLEGDYDTLVVPVEDLADYEECDLAGAQLQFPTGELVDVGEPGVASGSESTAVDYVLQWTNWGPDGVVATVRTPGTVTYWGTPSGLRQAYRGELQDNPHDD